MEGVVAYRHAKAMRDAQGAGIGIEDLARAMASMRGKDVLAEFDADQARGELTSGVFVECIVSAEILIDRATEYARQRRAARNNAIA